MADLKTIEDLTNAFGPSGFEEEVVKAVQKHCEGLNLRNDAMYNVYATMPDAKGNRPVFMLDAHTDECGFMVQNVEDNGLLSIITLGGFHMTSLPAHSVIVRNSKGEKIIGEGHIRHDRIADVDSVILFDLLSAAGSDIHL